VANGLPPRGGPYSIDPVSTMRRKMPENAYESARKSVAGEALI
jgi:hypothetical protein